MKTEYTQSNLKFSVFSSKMKELFLSIIPNKLAYFLPVILFYAP